MRTSKGDIARARKRMAGNGMTSRHWTMLGHWKFPPTLDEDGEVDLDATMVSFAHIYASCPIIAYEWAGRDMRWVVDSKRRPLCPACEFTNNTEAQSRMMTDVMLVGKYESILRKAATPDAMDIAEVLG